LTAVASWLSCCTPLSASRSSATASGAVSAAVSSSTSLPSWRSKKSWPPDRVATTSQEYTERGAHMSVVSSASVMNTCAAPSPASRLRGPRARGVTAAPPRCGAARRRRP